MITHLFGELDLDLSKSYDEIYRKAFDIGECCGYFADLVKDKTKIMVSGGDNEACIIYFKDGKVYKVKRAQFQDNGKILVPWQDVQIGSYEVMYWEEIINAV